MDGKTEINNRLSRLESTYLKQLVAEIKSLKEFQKDATKRIEELESQLKSK